MASVARGLCNSPLRSTTNLAPVRPDHVHAIAHAARSARRARRCSLAPVLGAEAPPMSTHAAHVQATINQHCSPLKRNPSPNKAALCFRSHTLLHSTHASHLPSLRRIYYYTFASLTPSLSGLRLLDCPSTLILSGACLSLAIACAL